MPLILYIPYENGTLFLHACAYKMRTHAECVHLSVRTHAEWVRSSSRMGAFPTAKLLGVSCMPQNISSSEGCSCNSAILVSLFVRPKNLKQVRRVLFVNPFDLTSIQGNFSAPILHFVQVAVQEI